MNDYSKYPPPKAFDIYSVTRGDLSIIEVSAGFFLYHRQEHQHWLSDGVDMFFDDSHESISPGTMEWWFAAYLWLEDQDELVEAYFPEFAENP